MGRRFLRLLGGLGRLISLLLIGPRWLLASGQVSAGGHWSACCLALALARDEGLELNLLGLARGLDVRRPAHKLPGSGWLGMSSVMKGQDGGTWVW